MLRVACLGAGYFGRFHYDGWARIPDVELVGSSDRDLSRATETGLPAFDDAARMLANTAPDILDIILPPSQHLAAIQLAAASGIPTAICQKPFCTSLAEARSAVALAKDAGMTLIVHENFRFQPWYRAIRQAMADGTIGTIHQITFRLRPGDGQGTDAYLDRQPYFRDMPRFLIRETGVHWIDTFRFLLGDPVAVYADLRRINPAIRGEDSGLVTFDHPGGARSVFDGNRHLDHAATNHRLTMGEALVEGTNGAISLTGDGAVHLRHRGDTTTTTLLAPRDWPGFGGDCVHALQAHVVRALSGGTQLENLAADYLRVLEIEEAIYKSAETGRKIALTA